MIKNVVLDIGNVLVTFYPDLYIAQFTQRKGEIDYYTNICFRSEEWKHGDDGSMTRAQIVDAICRKYPADEEMIRAIMADCESMLRASAQNTALLQKLRAHGINVYYLSNTNEPAFTYMNEKHAFFQYMNGGIASFRDGATKPGQEVFRLFLSRYGKNADECVFVDDTPRNTESASAVGFHTVTLKNIEDLTEELSKFPELAGIIRA